MAFFLTNPENSKANSKALEIKKDSISVNYFEIQESDIVLGSKDAQVTIIEYSSLSCQYCAKFHKKVMPKIKEEYIDSGKVNFVHRDSPLDLPSLYGAVALKCIENENYYNALNNLFLNANQWTKSNINFMLNLSNQLKSYGIKDEAHLKSCLKNKTLGQSVLDNRKIYREQMGIKSAPTFFINDKKIVGYKGLSKFKRIIDKELKNKR
jgi:protein-disulfide isomerase